ncbi:histidine kinase [Actinoallomurus iriomotensis]|jgi:Histidine kinase|uniref:Uncharacterized protein n=1 Tax=Actinoallomurus iriomotensis TaxID=478107 RepID=A0A9W6S519_9ACTN|nr:histidine kinase [Actinoallomurus iriomotensis]GLY87303.1 hypothetical protein Airi02_052320 [Actinoallomurus iriomotensis]
MNDVGGGSSPVATAEGGERVSPGMADVLMHRLFAVGLDLHAALTYIEANLGADVTVAKVHKAINGLDGAIKDFRGVVFDLRPEDSAGESGLRTLVVEAVERACGPGRMCPALTLGHGIEAVIDPSAWQWVARLVHRTLALVPGERLPDVHVMITADPRPPTWLVMHLDAPMGDLTEVAGRIRALSGRGMDVSCQDLPRSPERSRIRLEWPLPAH